MFLLAYRGELLGIDDIEVKGDSEICQVGQNYPDQTRHIDTMSGLWGVRNSAESDFKI
jgi:hypothetical protein